MLRNLVFGAALLAANPSLAEEGDRTSVPSEEGASVASSVEGVEVVEEESDSDLAVQVRKIEKVHGMMIEAVRLIVDAHGDAREIHDVNFGVLVEYWRNGRDLNTIVGRSSRDRLFDGNDFIFPLGESEMDGSEEALYARCSHVTFRGDYPRGPVVAFSRLLERRVDFASCYDGRYGFSVLDDNSEGEAPATILIDPEDLRKARSEAEKLLEAVREACSMRSE